METVSPMMGVSQMAMNIQMDTVSARLDPTCIMKAWATALYRPLSLASAVLGVGPHQ